MRYHIFFLSAVLLFLPLNLKAQYIYGKSFHSAFDNSAWVPEFNNTSAGDKLKNSISAKISGADQDDDIKKMQAFLKYYDKKLSEAHNNMVYQSKISSYKKQKPSKVYNGKDFNRRAMIFYTKIKGLRNNFNKRAQRLQMPTSYGKSIYPQRYVSIEYDERMSMKMTFEYYNYILSCTCNKADANIAKYLLSDRMSLLLDIANDALLVEDMPTFYWAISEISIVFINYKYDKPVLKHVFVNAKSLGI